ncbi:hypothetical protein [Vibrio aestuarianus]|uniref:Uncharacterized protein n=1 Tax=Vibrio aestuarianus TaxID=28171 RepID=A0A9X4F3A4_9VIBR|nr:hypothetical protein [Vibrio aestuarianus]MDE1243775.1 hypothetical protein [Vibrio aestuarianus]
MSSSPIRINLYALEDRLVAILVSINRLEYSYDRANVQTSVLFLAMSFIVGYGFYLLP